MISGNEIGNPGDKHIYVIFVKHYIILPSLGHLGVFPVLRLASTVKCRTSGFGFNAAQNVNENKNDLIFFPLNFIFLMFSPVHIYRPGNIRRLGGPMTGPGGGRGRGMNLLR